MYSHTRVVGFVIPFRSVWCFAERQRRKVVSFPPQQITGLCLSGTTFQLVMLLYSLGGEMLCSPPFWFRTYTEIHWTFNLEHFWVVSLDFILWNVHLVIHHPCMGTPSSSGGNLTSWRALIELLPAVVVPTTRSQSPPNNKPTFRSRQSPSG